MACYAPRRRGGASGVNCHVYLLKTVASLSKSSLRTQIESGQLPPGTALPSIVNLATKHGVATNTVQKALRRLKEEGLIESVPGYGTFVIVR